MSLLPHMAPKTDAQVEADVRRIDMILSKLYPQHETKEFRFVWTAAGLLKVQTKAKTEDENAWTDWTP